MMDCWALAPSQLALLLTCLFLCLLFCYIFCLIGTSRRDRAEIGVEVADWTEHNLDRGS